MSGTLDALMSQTVIDCSDLARAVGYPHPYTEAQRRLERDGWRYDIQYDAWFAPQPGFVE